MRSAAVVYAFAYAIALSFWAYDLVMGLAKGPPATVIPAYYFMGAFLSGFAPCGSTLRAQGAAH